MALLDEPRRGLVMPGLMGDHAEQMVRVGVVRRVPQKLAIKRFGPRQITGAVTACGFVKQRPGRGGMAVAPASPLPPGRPRAARRPRGGRGDAFQPAERLRPGPRAARHRAAKRWPGSERPCFERRGDVPARLRQAAMMKTPPRPVGGRRTVSTTPRDVLPTQRGADTISMGLHHRGLI